MQEFEVLESDKFKSDLEEAGRYVVTWIINESSVTLTLLEFLDSKYPQNLRGFEFDG